MMIYAVRKVLYAPVNATVTMLIHYVPDTVGKTTTISFTAGQHWIGIVGTIKRS
jgi:hypothetical protein